MTTKNTKESICNQMSKRLNREQWAAKMTKIIIVATVATIGCIILLLLLREYYLAHTPSTLFFNKK